MRTFRIKPKDLLDLRKPVPNSWAVLRLFYGVPKWAKYCYKDIRTDDIVFTSSTPK